MYTLSGFVFLFLALCCYVAMRRYESTQLTLVIIAVIALIVGMILLGLGLR